MRRVPVSVLLAMVPALAAGCAAEESGDAPTATIRDSAGVTIVENPAEAVAAAPAWSVDPEPELDVGVVEGEEVYQLDGIRDAVRLSDGAVAVADGGSSEIRVYGPDGRFRFSAGGPGEGPGEFQRLSQLHRLPGDSLLAFDWRQGRLSVFSPRGEFVRSRRLETAENARASLVGRLDDGTEVITEVGAISSPSETGVNRNPRTYLIRPPGGNTDTLVTLPGHSFHFETRGRMMTFTGVPFADGPHLTAGETHIYAGQSDAFEVAKYGADGEIERLIRLERAPRPVTDAEVEAMIEARTASVADETNAREMRNRLREMELPSNMPAFGGLAADAAGRLWVREYVPPGSESNDWIVFGPDGAVIATAALPPRFRPLEIGEDYVLGRWRDELDVDHLRLHRLRRGAEGTAGSGAEES